VRDVLRLVRAHNLVLAAIGVLAGGWIALEGIAMPPNVLWLAAAAAVGFGAAGNALNDIRDAAGDRVNRPGGERPLAAGRLARGTADLCVAGGTVLGFGAAALVSGTAVLVGGVALGVMAAYSPVLKRRGLPGNLAVALVAGLPLMYGALAVRRAGAGVVPWILAAWLHLVREIVKDLDDAAGDRTLGRRTLPIVLGARRAEVVAAALAAAFVPLSLALPAQAHYGGAYFLVALLAQLAVLVVASRLSGGRMRGNSLVLKGAMLVGIVALVAGRVR
jgi:geranylgeranylglycerol-phosphate geranylgeranyltransferase